MGRNGPGRKGESGMAGVPSQWEGRGQAGRERDVSKVGSRVGVGGSARSFCCLGRAMVGLRAAGDSRLGRWRSSAERGVRVLSGGRNTGSGADSVDAVKAVGPALNFCTDSEKERNFSATGSKGRAASLLLGVLPPGGAGSDDGASFSGGLSPDGFLAAAVRVEMRAPGKVRGSSGVGHGSQARGVSSGWTYWRTRFPVRAAPAPFHSSKQYGFIPGKSAVDAIKRYLEIVQDSNTKYTASLFIDTSGAFDNVWWPAMLKSLRRKHIPDYLVALIKSYVTDCSVEYTNGEITISKELLDTFLTLPTRDGVEMVAYADDIVIVVQANNRLELKQNLHSCMENLKNWASLNKLKLSASKSKIIVNRSPPRCHNRDLNVKVDGKSLQTVKVMKYLGAHIDHKLTFTPHIEKICEKARRIIFALGRKTFITWNIPIAESLHTIYRCCIIPIMAFGSEGYRSVSNEAAGVIAGIPPLDLVLAQVNCKKVLRKEEETHFLQQNLNRREFDNLSQIKEYLSLLVNDHWQYRWENSQKGRTTYAFIPTVEGTGSSADCARNLRTSPIMATQSSSSVICTRRNTIPGESSMPTQLATPTQFEDSDLEDPRSIIEQNTLLALDLIQRGLVALLACNFESTPSPQGSSLDEKRICDLVREAVSSQLCNTTAAPTYGAIAARDPTVAPANSQILKDLRLKAVPIKKRWPRMLIADVPASATQDQLVEELSGQNLPDSVPEQFIGKIFKHLNSTLLPANTFYTQAAFTPPGGFLKPVASAPAPHTSQVGAQSATTHRSTNALTANEAQFSNIIYKKPSTQPSTTLMDSKHKVIQVNLKKSRTATEELTAHMLNNNIPIALVQEPYICRHGSNFKIPNLNGLQMAASTSAKFLAAIIYNKDCASPLFVPQLSNNHIDVISAQLETTQIFFASVYLLPSTDIRTEIPALQRVVEATPRTTPHIEDWKVSECITMSDHNAVTFTCRIDSAANTTTEIEPKYAIDYSLVTPEYIAETLQGWSDKFDAKFPDLPNAKIIRRKRFAHRPDWWTDEIERHRKVYMAKKTLLYRNRHPDYTDHLYSEMKRARERFERKLAVARKKAGTVSYNTTLTKIQYLLHKLLPDDDLSSNTGLQHDSHRDFISITPLNHNTDPFSIEELDRLVHELRPNKAPGLDRLSGRLIKLTHPHTGQSLLRILNACWNLGYFPRTWKHGNLVILLKDPAGDTENVKNYRPITLLPTYGKLLEKLIKIKLSDALTPLHSPHQFGFTSGRSTTNALLTYKAAVSDSPRKYVLTIFVDIRGAFDNVWWPGLFDTLRTKQLPHEILAIIKSYLTDRSVSFTQGKVTATKNVTKGCPQDSVLGPTLWNLLLDPLLDSVWPEGTKAVAYADDLAIITAHDSRKTLKIRAQAALELVTNWATKNKLFLCTEKTVFMVHKSPSRVHHRNLRLLLYDAPIKQTLRSRANTLRALKRGGVSMFQDELIIPGNFETVAHAAQYLQLRAEDIWQARWDNSTKGRTTYAFLPEVTTDIATLPALDFVRTQVLTGHGNFRCHLHRIGKEDDDTCDACPGATDDPIHRVLDCPKYLAAQELINEETRSWPPLLTQVPALSNNDIFAMLASNNPTHDI
ncbi:hypothetical protein GEV33_009299 [Tenebrio molitor]|uniref:Reverse transcriptase domain-containing protein n=1 Tax=Tenebrio molitor TaxID=7067 RepID=A0A8J6HG21_TENMO|nr:hypothetical protein GEV33_009299 [Tenebrio molitor]